MRRLDWIILRFPISSESVRVQQETERTFKLGNLREECNKRDSIQRFGLGGGKPERKLHPGVSTTPGPEEQGEGAVTGTQRQGCVESTPDSRDATPTSLPAATKPEALDGIETKDWCQPPGAQSRPGKSGEQVWSGKWEMPGMSSLHWWSDCRTVLCAHGGLRSALLNGWATICSAHTSANFLLLILDGLRSLTGKFTRRQYTVYMQRWWTTARGACLWLNQSLGVVVFPLATQRPFMFASWSATELWMLASLWATGTLDWVGREYWLFQPWCSQPCKQL